MTVAVGTGGASASRPAPTAGRCRRGSGGLAGDRRKVSRGPTDPAVAIREVVSGRAAMIAAPGMTGRGRVARRGAVDRQAAGSGSRAGRPVVRPLALLTGALGVIGRPDRVADPSTGRPSSDLPSADHPSAARPWAELPPRGQTPHGFGLLHGRRRACCAKPRS